MAAQCDHVWDAVDIPGWPYLCRVCGLYWKQIPDPRQGGDGSGYGPRPRNEI